VKRERGRGRLELGVSKEGWKSKRVKEEEFSSLEER
jgi:hypothetical protein